MENTYYDASNPGSYGGVDRLRRASKKPAKAVKNFLQSQKTYQLHKQRRIRFPRRKYIVSNIDDLWQADLADLSKLKNENDGIAYLLVVIDVFSKVLWVRPLSQKTAELTLDAIANIIETSGRRPRNFMTDKGTEFLNQASRDYFTSIHVNFYTANNAETKAAVAERVIRTLKSRISRYLTANKSKRYIDALQDIVKSYNNSKHRTIGMKPVEVNKNTEGDVRQKAFLPSFFSKPPSFQYKKRDHVRIAILPNRFAKGYEPQWTEEIFQISSRLPTIPPTYKLTDTNGEKISGSFYEPELQLVPEDSQSIEDESPPPSPEL